MGLILHGRGGVGKSATLKVCAQWAEHILKRAGDNPNKLRILFLCPTVMAANVMELWSVVRQKREDSYLPLLQNEEERDSKDPLQ